MEKGPGSCVSPTSNSFCMSGNLVLCVTATAMRVGATWLRMPETGRRMRFTGLAATRSRDSMGAKRIPPANSPLAHCAHGVNGFERSAIDLTAKCVRRQAAAIRDAHGLVEGNNCKATAHRDATDEDGEVLESRLLWQLHPGGEWEVEGAGAARASEEHGSPTELKEVVYQVVERVKVPPKAVETLRPSMGLHVNAANRIAGLVPVLDPRPLVDLWLPIT